MTDRRIALRGKISHVIIDVEHRASSVRNAPDHDDRNFDRITLFVVYLLLIVIQCHRFERKFLRDPRHSARGIDRRTERIDPEKPFALQRTVIFTEEREHIRLIGLQKLESPDHHHRNDQQDNARERDRNKRIVRVLIGKHQPDNDQHDAYNRQQQENSEHQPTVFLTHVLFRKLLFHKSSEFNMIMISKSYHFFPSLSTIYGKIILYFAFYNAVSFSNICLHAILQCS